MPTVSIDGGASYFVHVPRTGGTSFCAWLGNRAKRIGRLHASAEELKAVMAPGATCFGVVRNPWDRVVSQFYYDKDHALRGTHVESLMDEIGQFEQWLVNDGMQYLEHPQFSTGHLLCDAANGEPIATPILFHDFLALYSEIPHENYSKERNGRVFPAYFRNASNREAIARIAQWEIDRFGFRCEIPGEAL